MPSPTKYQRASGSNPFDKEAYEHEAAAEDRADDMVEYFHELDVCAEEDFWWDEEDRHEL